MDDDRALAVGAAIVEEQNRFVPVGTARDRLMPSQFGDTPFIVGENFVAALETPTMEQVQALFSQGNRMTEAGRWIMIDALYFAHQFYGEEGLVNLNLLGVDHRDARNKVWIGTYWRPHLRVPGATVSHHQVLTPMLREAMLNSDEEGINRVRMWLAEIVAMDMSRDELRDDVRSNSLPPSLRENGVDAADPLVLEVRTLAEEYQTAADNLKLMRPWLQRHEGQEFLPFVSEAVRMLEKAARWAQRGVIQ